MIKKPDIRMIIWSKGTVFLIWFTFLLNLEATIANFSLIICNGGFQIRFCLVCNAVFIALNIVISSAVLSREIFANLVCIYSVIFIANATVKRVHQDVDRTCLTCCTQTPRSFTTKLSD